MALLNILNVDTDENTLRKISRAVDGITPRTIRLLDDMKETLKASGGVGLAAPQVGVLRRVVVIDNGEQMLELINPVITATEGEQDDAEACLSVPGKWGMVCRPMTVTVSALDRNGNTVTYTDSGLIARCFCHELDHLDGVLYTDKASRMLDPDEIEQ